MKKAFLLAVFIILGVIHAASAGSVSLSEVLFDPEGSDTGKEYIKIYNSGDTAVALAGWELYPDGIGYFVLPAEFSLGPKGTIAVHMRVSGTNAAGDFYHAAATENMGNTSGSAALFSSNSHNKDTMQSFVQWGRGGQTWETAALGAGLWEKGTYVGTASTSEGLPIIRFNYSASGAESWGYSVVSPNLGVVSSSASTSLLTASSTIANMTRPQPIINFPIIKVYAGEDVTAAVGSSAEFHGVALGFNDAPLENARFWWNFGDGDAKEGKTVSHAFAIPGTYVVGLHVSADSFSASDYLRVNVVPNKISVREVVEGEKGFVKLGNPDNFDIDVGGWILDDTTHQFILTPKTKIGATSEVGFPNSLTRLFLTLGERKFILRYPNGDPAVSWSKIPNFVTQPERDPVPVLEKKTPPPRAADVSMGVVSSEFIEKATTSKNQQASVSTKSAAIGWRPPSWGLALTGSIVAGLLFLAARTFLF